MNIGAVIESAIWTTGDERPELRPHHERQINIAMDRLCEREGVIRSPVVFIEKRPGEDRVPPVPDKVQGQRVRLLVGEATIVGRTLETSQGSFVANLERKDLVRLRKIARDQAAKSRMMLTNQQCDALIDRLGPEAALETLRKSGLH